MKKAISLLLALALCLSLCACGNSTSPAKENETSAESAQTTNESTAESTEAVVEPSAGPAFCFTLEDARITTTSSSVKVEAKIRNNSEQDFVGVCLIGVVLDENGDILADCAFIYYNGLEAGQAGWEQTPIRESEVAQNMAYIKLISVSIAEGADKSYGIATQLSEPIVIDLISLK